MSLMPNTAPEGFRARFIADGWRGIERYYGARTKINRKWIADVGGLDKLQAERAEARRMTKTGAAISMLMAAQLIMGGEQARAGKSHG